MSAPNTYRGSGATVFRNAAAVLIDGDLETHPDCPGTDRFKIAGLRRDDRIQLGNGSGQGQSTQNRFIECTI